MLYLASPRSSRQYEGEEDEKRNGTAHGSQKERGRVGQAQASRILASKTERTKDLEGSVGFNRSALRTVHPNRIKIDISLVRGIGAGPQDEALVHAVLALGKALGAVVLAEGVETMEQHDFLLAHGCREMQGFLFARPLSFNALLIALQDPESSFPKRPESLVPC
jgi:EAL domain